MSAYEHLAVLAERELALVEAGRFGELGDLHARRDQLVATLPAVPPAEARDALERTAALQDQVTEALAHVRDAVGHELAKLRRGRGAVRAYGQLGSPGAPGATRHA